MTADLYLHPHSFQFQDLAELEEKLETFIQTKLYAKEHADDTHRHDSLYEIETPLGPIFELMFTPGALPGDVQIALSQAIDQNTPCDIRCESAEELEIVFEGRHSGFLGFEFNTIPENSDRCVFDLESWRHFHRQYFVAHPPSAREITTSKPGAFGYYFPNLYLCTENVPPSLRTLHDDHQKLIQTIIHHLSALNDYFYPEFIQGEQGADSVCDALENQYRSHKVRIGASRDSGGKNELNFTFTDPGSGRRETCYCDLHTKFYRFFEVENPSPEQRSARIYFHQPKDGFIGGKVLVAHIGKHL